MIILWATQNLDAVFIVLARAVKYVHRRISAERFRILPGEEYEKRVTGQHNKHSIEIPDTSF